MSELNVDKPSDVQQTQKTMEKNQDVIINEDGYTKMSDQEIKLENPNNEDLEKSIKFPEEDKSSLTLRAVLVGSIIGILVAAMNVNFGLKTGWTQGGSVFASILSIGIFKIVRPLRHFTKYEAVIATTCASSAGTMTGAAGLVSCIPALKLLGHSYSILQLFLWAISIAYFGVYFAVPLRKQMLEIDKLRFPSGTATAETIKAMFAKGVETLDKAKMLLYWAIGTSIFALAAFFIPYLEQPPMPALLVKWGWVIYIDPLLLGGGMLSGPRACSSLLLGSIVGWAILGPIIYTQGWVKSDDVLSYSGVRGWILWVGVAIMTADSFTQLLFSVRTIFSGFISLVRRLAGVVRRTSSDEEETPGQIPSAWWVIGLVMSTILLTLVGQFVFNIQFYFTWIAIPISAILSIIASRCSGETDINPVGGVGKVTQLVFAGLAPGQITTNLLTAGVTAAGASQCGDMMSDLKTGYLIGVQPRSQFIAQCVGILFGIVFAIPVYKLFDLAYNIGGEQVPAPAAHAWKAVAVILSKGFSDLPTHSIYGIIAGLVFGVFIGLLYKVVQFFKKDYAEYIPSALAFGIGMIVPPRQAMTMFFGAFLFLFWKRVHPDSAGKYFFAVSSGMISGEGLMGVVIAILKLLGVRPLFNR